MDEPIALIRRQQYKPVPLIIGTNSYEGNFILFYLQNIAPSDLSLSQYRALVEQLFVTTDTPYVNYDLVTLVLTKYEPYRQQFGNWLALQQVRRGTSIGNIYLSNRNIDEDHINDRIYSHGCNQGSHSIFLSDMIYI